MENAQADALSNILAEMATKTDLERLISDLTWRMIATVGLFGTIITILRPSSVEAARRPAEASLGRRNES